MSDAPSPKSPDGKTAVGEEIGRKAARKLRAQRERHRSIWFGLGMLGVVGWAVVIPTLLGAALGRWLDASGRGRVSWTVTLLLVGLVIGCVNAWYWVKRESGRE
jgi:ATP synthase protein I